MESDADSKLLVLDTSVLIHDPHALRSLDEHSIAPPMSLSMNSMGCRRPRTGARAGTVTGVILAAARIAGETAPLLFAAFNNHFWSLKLTQPLASLPVQIFDYAISPYEEWHQKAWAGALVKRDLDLVQRAMAADKGWMTSGGPCVRSWRPSC